MNSKKEVKAWLVKNRRSIEAGFATHATNLKRQGNFEWGDFMLSELGLCYAIPMNLIPLPDGYQSKLVSKIEGEGVKRSATHYCAFNENDNSIIDFTLPQFFRENLPLIGALALIRRAPQLFIVLTQQIVVMHATLDEVRSDLNLAYRF